jgi:hypothetical protein
MGANNVDNVSKNLFLLAEVINKDNDWHNANGTTPYDWDDMPEFVQENKEAYEEVTVRFRCKEDLEAFANLIGQLNIVPPKKRKKSIWYPAIDRNANSLLFWVDETEE